MIIEFKGNILYWRDAALFLFVAVPEEPSRDLKAISAMVKYGWALIPTYDGLAKLNEKLPCSPKWFAILCLL